MTGIVDSSIGVCSYVYASAVIGRYQDDVERSFIQHPGKAAPALADSKRLACFVPFQRDGCIDAFLVAVGIALVFIEGE